MINISEKTYNSVIVIQRSDNTWGVTDLKGNIIVPFGKYAWISPFDSGLARVRSHGIYGELVMVFDSEGNVISGEDAINEYVKKNKPYSKWGIINEKGEEVLPVEYDEVWNFYRKNRYSTRVVKDGVIGEVYLHNLNPNLPERGITSHVASHDDYDDYGTHYGEFAGSYAQDVMEYSDDVINDAFEGDPDAYWNID